MKIISTHPEELNEKYFKSDNLDFINSKNTNESGGDSELYNKLSEDGINDFAYGIVRNSSVSEFRYGKNSSVRFDIDGNIGSQVFTTGWHSYEQFSKFSTIFILDIPQIVSRMNTVSTTSRNIMAEYITGSIIELQKNLETSIQPVIDILNEDKNNYFNTDELKQSRAELVSVIEEYRDVFDWILIANHDAYALFEE